MRKLAAGTSRKGRTGFSAALAERAGFLHLPFTKEGCRRAAEAIAAMFFQAINANEIQPSRQEGPIVYVRELGEVAISLNSSALADLELI